MLQQQKQKQIVNLVNMRLENGRTDSFEVVGIPIPLIQEFYAPGVEVTSPDGKKSKIKSLTVCAKKEQ